MRGKFKPHGAIQVERILVGLSDAKSARSETVNVLKVLFCGVGKSNEHD
jgi:hypothetical protein